MDDLLDAYYDGLAQYAVPFAPLDVPGSWHLTMFVIESFKPEVIYDFDCRRGDVLIHRARLFPSLWEAISQAKGTKSKTAPIIVERSCEHLPQRASIRSLVEEEAIFRLTNGRSLGVDGTTVNAIFACHGCAPFRRTCWQPANLSGTGWPELLAAVEDAASGLPKSDYF
jgi:hypothetical protein